MSVPTVPTLTTLVTEGLKKTGRSSPTAAQITRAEDYYIEECKNDLWLLGKRLKCLQHEDIQIVTSLQSRYSFPTNFSSIISAVLLQADDTDTLQAAASTSLTLSSDEDISEEDLIGKEIVIRDGTGIGEISQVTAYDEDTYISTMSPAFGTTPDGTETYMIVDTNIPLKLRQIAEYDELYYPTAQDLPTTLYQVGDENQYGYFLLDAAPEDDYDYAIRIRYYLDLMSLDLAGTRMATLYKRWRNLFIQGVKARQLEDDDDDRARVEMDRYLAMVRDTVSLETYGRNIQPQYTGISA